MVVSWRNKKASFLHLFTPFLFMFMLWIVQKSMQASSSPTPSNTDVNAPIPIPPCEHKLFISRPCFDFVWSGNSTARISLIVDRIRSNNPNRPIPSSKVISFATPEEVDTWLLANPNRCPGALHFSDRNSSVIGYGIQTNSTSILFKSHRQDTVFHFQIPLQIAAEREISRSLLGDTPGFSWSVGFKEFPHPISTQPDLILQLIPPVFFLAAALFGFIFQMSPLIMEKQLKLREAMDMMGLYDTAYWLSWLAWETILVFISSLLILIFGMLFHFPFFLRNSFMLLFFVFFLFQLNMTAVAFMLSTLITNTSSTTTVGFINFIIGFLVMLVNETARFPYGGQDYFKTASLNQIIRFLWSFYPPNLLAEAITQLHFSTMTPENGLTWSGRTQCQEGGPCTMTINKIYIWLMSTFLLWFLLAIYLENVIPNSYGVRKSIYYFLNPGYWTGKAGVKVKEGGTCSCIGRIPQSEDTRTTPGDVDVVEEENHVKQQVAGGEVDPNVAVQLRGLAKLYPGARKVCCCGRKSAFHALKGIWVNFAKDQLFCLLGPNGAGKTTVINCLTGITPLTAGDALVYGNSIRSFIGMSNIRSMIGMCPQFDILWDALNGEEHLYLFASIKGIPPPLLKQVVQESLHAVRLTHAARVRVSGYSGGMKRRLNFSIALIGDPKLIILDEPTTGMDPINRRHVWDMIQNAKQGRAIVLTTHSMEEADVLSDRIGIMAKGRLQCIGTSIRLKSRFGSGFVANVSFHSNLNTNPSDGDATDSYNQKALKQLFKSRLNVVPRVENQAFTTFVIPNQKEELLPGFFAELQDRVREFGIVDVQLGLTTLEEVFLNIARQAEVESSTTEGKMVTLTLTTSGTKVKIPRGVRFVGITGTESAENPRGIMVEVYWEQDDTGSLCISGHSPEIPVPETAHVTPAGAPRSRQGFLGRKREVHGVIITLPDPTTFRT